VKIHPAVANMAIRPCLSSASRRKRGEIKSEKPTGSKPLLPTRLSRFFGLGRYGTAALISPVGLAALGAAVLMGAPLTVLSALSNTSNISSRLRSLMSCSAARRTNAVGRDLEAKNAADRATYESKRVKRRRDIIPCC
jgi:hypothetical protein